MKYIRPKEYSGFINTERQQLIHKAYVEANCLKCDKFNGEEHDFSECKMALLDYKNTTCPPECRKPIPIIYPEIGIHMQSKE